MHHKVGIWIDHKKAVVVSASGDGVTSTTLASEVGPHARYSGRSGYPTADGPHDGRGEKASLLIFGPGEAKLQLKARLRRSHTLSDRIVSIEATDKLTDPQIAAKVREHYGI